MATAVAGSSGSGTSTSSAPPQIKDQRLLAKFIKKHIRTKKGVHGMDYTKEQVVGVLDMVKAVLLRQETLVKVRVPMCIVGDVHGQYTDLKRILSAHGRPPDQSYVFLGDYVDRGRYSLECVMLLFAYKALYPDTIVLLRGNHECEQVNRIYGFYDEMHRRGLGQLYPDVNAAFNCLPLAALIKKRILCMHGGISQYLTSLDQIKNLQRPNPLIEGHPLCPPFAVDLLWADPNKSVTGYVPSDREISYEFGLDALEQFCRQMKVEVVVRGHQVVPKGFERVDVGGKTRLVTLFSAPNYCNEMDNSAAVMTITDQLQIHFHVLEPTADDAQYLAERSQDRKHTPHHDVFPKSSNPFVVTKNPSSASSARQKQANKSNPSATNSSTTGNNASRRGTASTTSANITFATHNNDKKK